MSSTGYISSVMSAPTTSLGEDKRKSSMDTGSSATANEKVIVERGIIREIHPENMMVRATTEDGHIIANGGWIALAYPSVEFTQGFGEVQVGDVIQVTSIGIGGNASATIIGRAGEVPENSVRMENKVKMGVGPFLFPPGIGVG